MPAAAVKKSKALIQKKKKTAGSSAATLSLRQGAAGRKQTQVPSERRNAHPYEAAPERISARSHDGGRQSSGMQGHKAGRLQGQSARYNREQSANYNQEQTAAKPAKKGKYYDYSLLFAIILITGIGLLMIYSSSQYTARIQRGSSSYYFFKQLKIAAAGFVAAVVMSKLFNYKWLRHFDNIAWILSVLLLVATLATGSTTNGSTRWLSLGGMSFQPTEAVKTAIIIFVASKVSSLGYSINQPANIAKLVALCLLPILLITKENLSSGIILTGIVFFMLFTSVRDSKPFYALGALGLGALLAAKPLAVKVITEHNLGRPESYQLRRIFGWALPESFPDDAYQTLQGLYAIGSGGITGQGLGGSIQKFSKLPEAQNDMIFSIICEELGLVGAIAIVIVFIFIIYRLMMIAANAEDLFGSLIVVGIAAHISIQVILNIAVVTGVIPNTGVTLPFISYGGTAVLLTMIEMGIALNVSNNIRPHYDGS